MKTNKEKARDKVVNDLIKAFSNLRAFANKPYSFVVPVEMEDGSISFVKVGVTSCSDRFNKDAETLPAESYVSLERQAREFIKSLSS